MMLRTVLGFVLLVAASPAAAELRAGFGSASITPAAPDTWTDVDGDGRFTRKDRWEDQNGNGKFDAV
ncbi:MAG TPA: hypothetical protein VFX50_07620, partial [Gemmatimonadales bacterium]|nr:hypothetical protein [Gemmatimonadales bacterium]